ncbi:phosphomannomutase/phosphoglucomutase [Swaminathania salitolerans]|uniref:Phosphomannomutase n=1 Tax=Swaminathania salitolerans TaxID=182838 RepID=A0A511BQK4_9PROT|nr:phosphomannomutase/phosphoglucomutase [Swaminathania salitolerans]GBQ10660.1 phosphomannomutase [Swaminathania salitolerans LMG 21291]GEL02123.1 phosphomannomutase [Swaminathania salitolerans]
MTSEAKPFRHDFDPTILRAYDIRGIVGKTLTTADAYALGLGLGALSDLHGEKRAVTGHDGRHTSPALDAALVRGLLLSGFDVSRMGCCATPELYHACHAHAFPVAVMVTGSHNPPDYNGFKILVSGRPFSGAALGRLASQLSSGVMPENCPGGERRLATWDAYVEALSGGYRPGGRALRIVWDNSHSSAGPALSKLIARLPGTHSVINGTIDGSFPSHHPDPSIPANMRQLQDEVRRVGADIGLAFDGDADRLGVVDENGAIVPADRLGLFLATGVRAEKPGCVILGDVKTSRVFFDFLREGGPVLMCPSGHSEVKQAIARERASFASEMSGHFFFADRWPGFDDGLYAAVRVLDLLSRQSCPLSQCLARFPVWASTEEIRLDCPESRKHGVVREVESMLGSGTAGITRIDGLRVQEEEGWWLLRASNTQPALSLRVEAVSVAAGRRLYAYLTDLLRACGLALPAQDPFEGA